MLLSIFGYPYDQRSTHTNYLSDLLKSVSQFCREKDRLFYRADTRCQEVSLNSCRRSVPARLEVRIIQSSRLMSTLNCPEDLHLHSLVSSFRETRKRRELYVENRLRQLLFRYQSQLIKR